MLRTFEMFAGYGGWSYGLNKAGIDFETVGYAEIDKYAIQCYNQNHYELVGDYFNAEEPYLIKNYGDCTKIDPNEIPDFDLLCASPPCQSFSIAGKGKGEMDSRGRLFEDTINIMKIKQPKYAIYENVKGLTTKTHKEYFEYILNLMKDAGYYVTWKVLNTKEHGIPQNRERVFIICFKDKEEHDNFKFPEKEELKIFLKDILEDDVDEKYYLNEKQIGKITNSNFMQEKLRIQKGDVCSALLARDYKDPKCIQVGMISQTCKKRTFETPKEINEYLKKNKGNYTIKEIADYVGLPKTQVEHYFRTDSSRAIPDIETWFALKKLLGFDDAWNREVSTIYEKEITFESSRRVYSDQGCSPTISATNADKIIQLDVSQIKREGKPRIYEKVSKCLNTAQGGGHTPLILQRPHGYNGGGTRTKDGVVPALTSGASWEHNNYLLEKITVRKLTPRECFRLQGFLNDEINLEGLSNSQRYKLAGNGLTITVVQKIFEQMFKKPKGL